MRRISKLLRGNELLTSSLVLACICRAISVLLLNKGYSGLIDNLLYRTHVLVLNSAALLLCAGAAQIAAMAAQNWLSSALSEKAGLEARTAVMNGILKADYGKAENLSAGESISKMNSDLTGMTSWVKNELSSIFSDGVLFVFAISALLFANWKLTVISFCIIPFCSVGSYLLSKPITRTEKERVSAAADVCILAKSMMEAFPVMKLFQMTQPLLGKADKAISLSMLAEKKANGIRAKLMSVNGFMSFLPTAAIWGFGGCMAIAGKLSAGELFAFINLSGFVTGPLLNLPSRIDGIRTSSSCTSRIFDLLDHLSIVEKGGVDMSRDHDDDIILEFRNVTFGYSRSKTCLQNISFQVKKGSKVAITGESGCGKSTLLKLAAGLYHADEGEVRLFGRNLEDTDISAIRSRISFVPQESQLFPTSILDNITCGHPMDMDRVNRACREALLEDLITALPEGIHTNVGECGNKLSGGERQRICIARAIARDAPLFLLDEAVSSLDGQTENRIMQSFDNMIGTKTMIFITHGIKNAINADLILCMKNGRICESGKHAELLAADGYYAKLYKLQNMLEALSDEENKSAAV